MKTYVFEFKSMSGIVRNTKARYFRTAKPTADQIAHNLVSQTEQQGYEYIEPLKVWSYGE